MQKAMLQAHNRERASEGKPPLTLDPLLTEAAAAHSRDMAAREQMSHQGSDGSDSSERIRRAGYHYLREGENVAAGQTSVAELISGWMDSPGHRANILGDFTQMGAARAKGKDGWFYWTVCFGTPLPKIDPETAVRSLIEAINARRAADDQPPVAVSDVLTRVAREAAQELVEKKKKELPNQSKDVFEKVRAGGYPFTAIRSSSSAGQFTAQDMLDALKRQNEDGSETSAVLGPFTDVGVGVAIEDDGVPTWVVLLASKQQQPSP
jgi:uncharacterized protein YkwD